MEFEKAKELFKKNTETMAAYSHAMGVLSYDSETAAPKNSAKNHCPKADSWLLISHFVPTRTATIHFLVY